MLAKSGQFAGGGVQNLNVEVVRQFSIPLPTVQEQRAIAAALSDVDALLDGLERLIAKKRDLKQAAMQQLLTGQTRLPGFSGEWEIKRLGDLAKFYKGKGLPKSALTPFGSEPCIHYGELFTQYGETIRETISRTDKNTGDFRSVANDVLMPTSDVTPRGLAKASCVVIDEVVLGGDILVIRTDPAQVCGTFLSHVIRREEDQVLRLVTGTTVFHLYGTDMKKFVLKLPLLAEQQAIVEVLADMDAELAALEARRDKTRALKQGMMQELLTGKTRLL
jgi:type I restriction enzyme S subunit